MYQSKIYNILFLTINLCLLSSCAYIQKSFFTSGNGVVSFLACYFLFHNVVLFKSLSLNHLDRLGTSINEGNIDEENV